MKYNMFSSISFHSIVWFVVRSERKFLRARVTTSDRVDVICLEIRKNVSSSTTKCRYKMIHVYLRENSNYMNGLLLAHNVLPFFSWYFFLFLLCVYLSLSSSLSLLHRV